jgi:hypothetical protein
LYIAHITLNNQPSKALSFVGNGNKLQHNVVAMERPQEIGFGNPTSNQIILLQISEDGASHRLLIKQMTTNIF